MTSWLKGNWDITKPDDNRDPKLGCDDIREFKDQVEERLGSMVYGFDDIETNKDLLGFKKAIFRPQSTPNTITNAILLYGKDVDGKCRLHQKNEDGVESELFPAGIIAMWSGTIAHIPVGWSLCDGDGGRPDLHNKFIKGVLTNTTNPGGTGGSASDTHTHTGPSHTHSVTTSNHNHTTSNHTHSLDQGETIYQSFTIGPKVGTYDDSPNTDGQLYTYTTSGTTPYKYLEPRNSNTKSGGNGTSGSNGGETKTTTSSGTGATGVPSATHLPPYYELAFIWKN